MAILAECPMCHSKQSNKNKVCKCGEDLDQAKRSRRVRYWIHYQVKNKQIREPVSYSIEEARDAMGKRRGQRRENKIFDMLPESKLTFQELTDWYLSLASIKELASYDRTEQVLRNFNAVFGQWTLGSIKQTDLEEYQISRKGQGRADASIDMEIKLAQAAVTKAFDNDKIGGHSLKAFRRTKKLLEKGANVRTSTVGFEQYLSLSKVASSHYRAVLIIAFNTGMRLGEIKQLKWSHIDRGKSMIRLPKEITKEARVKAIPINHHVKAVLEALPRTLPPNDFIITYRGKPLNGKSSLKKQFPETCQKAKIAHGRKTLGGITFHDIRRTVKTNMLNAGVDKVHRDLFLGHSLTGMDSHYIMPNDESLTSAMQRYTKWVDRQIEAMNLDRDELQSLD